jgi:CheY-like chemotaxis protein
MIIEIMLKENPLNSFKNLLMQAPKIAVLDDDEHWCFLVQRFLRNHFEVSTFQSFSELLPRIDQFELVIVDFSIPPRQYQENIDGCEMIRRIKQQYSPAPILVLSTAFISSNNLEFGKQLCPEADHFIAKDAGLDTVLEVVQTLLKAHQIEC